MATSQFVLIFILFSWALRAAAVTAHNEVPVKQDKTTTVVVQGKVYCQDFGSWSLIDVGLIPAPKVSVICKNHKKKVTYYKAFESDKNGYFYAQAKIFTITHYLLDHPLLSFHAKLFSSLLESCNLLSNVNNGINDSPLRFKNKNKVLYQWLSFSSCDGGNEVGKAPKIQRLVTPLTLQRKSPDF